MVPHSVTGAWQTPQNTFLWFKYSKKECSLSFRISQILGKFLTQVYIKAHPYETCIRLRKKKKKAKPRMYCTLVILSKSVILTTGLPAAVGGCFAKRD